MSFKYINKYLFIICLIFVYSCKTSDTKNQDDYDKNSDIEISKSFLDIKNYNNSKNYLNKDYYSKFSHSNIESIIFSKNKVTKNFFNKKFNESRPLPFFYYENNLITIDHKSVIRFYETNQFKEVKSINIKNQFDNKLYYPTSVANINDNFFASYSLGIITSFDLDGNINWSHDFKDLIKTPIKIFNGNIIVILGDKIISLDSLSGKIIWEYVYESKNQLQIFGGDIINLNHILFFIMPNGRVGEIDTFFGEKNISAFSKLKFKNFIDNSYDRMHSFDNYLSYFDQNKYL